MKILKTKNNFRGLSFFVAIFAASLLLTSCQKDEITDSNALEVNKQVVPEDRSIGLLLPQNILEMGEDAVKDYLDQASSELISKYVKDYQTANYLEEVDKLNSLISEFYEIQSSEEIYIKFDEIDLAKYLSEDELVELSTRIEASITESSLNLRACYNVPGGYECKKVTKCRSRNWQGLCTGGYYTTQDCKYKSGYTWCDGHW